VPRIAGLDGLRALAVIAVLLYHGGLLAGGFLGVEVFFVISGYLITRILIDEWQRDAHIDLCVFWLRRVRRLWPALFAMILVTVGFSTLALPDELFALRGAAIAGVLWISNWYSILVHQSYFEAVGRPPLLRHLWSLGIEAQFYALWPPALLLALRLGRIRRLWVGSLAGALASAWLMALLFQPDADPSRVYYGTDTRASGLLIGAALALAPAKWLLDVPSAVCGGAVCAALIGLGLLCARLTEFDPFLYRGGFLTVDALSALAIAATVHHRGRLGRAVLEIRPLRWIGVRSYGIYLWHWPVLMLTRPHLDVRLDGWPLLMVRLLLIGALAELSYRFVELPFRRGKIRWVPAAGGLAAGVLVFAPSVAATQPDPRPAYLPVDAIDTWSRANVVSASELIADDEATAQAVGESNVESDTDAAGVQTSGLDDNMLQITSTGHLRVTAIGDSVMLGAVGALEADIDGIEIDAAISRQTSAAIELLRDRRVAGQLGDVVVVHLGNNGALSSDQFDAMMDVLAKVPRVLFLTVKVPRAWENPNDAVLADGVQRYSNTVLVDWRGTSLSRPDYFWDDGIHLRPEGAAAYAALISSNIGVGE
jgi:peptidoglycan/LPS O-acetylase OafA/YrhL